MEAGSAAGTLARARTIRTDIPARMDRLPWARWHWLSQKHLEDVAEPLSAEAAHGSQA